MTSIRRDDAILEWFPPDIQRWLAETAKRERVDPAVIVRERVRELAEVEKAARECA